MTTQGKDQVYIMLLLLSYFSHAQLFAMLWTILSLPQLTAACAFSAYTAQAPGCSAGVLFKVGPAFCALPRSKPLRFSGTPQGHRLGWAYTSCPSQVQAAQETRCLASGLTQVGRASYSTTQSLPLSFLGVP